MNNFYFCIAGFRIKTLFKKSKLPGLSGKYKSGFTFPLQDFKIAKPQKTDFTIEFCDIPKNIPPSLKKPRVLVKKNKIIVYYQDYTFFKTVLETALYILCSEKKGIIIHSSSINSEVGAFLFLGPAGAGKSTISRILGSRFTSLTDDTTILRKQKGKYYIYQHPFLERNNYSKNDKPYLVKKVYFLRKNKSISEKKIKDKERTISKLAKQLTITDPRIMKNLMSFVKTFNDFYTLSFSKNKKNLVQFFEEQI